MKMQLETARKDSIQKVRLQEKPIQRGFYQVRQSDIIRASSDSISLSTPNGPASYDALTNGLSFRIIQPYAQLGIIFFYIYTTISTYKRYDE